MAGIGVKLNRLYEKDTLLTDLIGFAYSTAVTIAPMLVVIFNILIMGKVLELSKQPFVPRELFSSTILYMFIFSLLTTSPFDAVLSRYMSDVIYEERYDDILPCYYVGLILNVVLASALGIPFCVREYLVGHISVLYVFTGFCGYVALVLVFYSMTFLSICKDYKRISEFYTIGMVLAFVLSLVFVKIFGMEVTNAMLLSLVLGFIMTASLEVALIKRYFQENSGQYKPVFFYFKKYWQLVITNFFYIFGLYIHNFVFWTTSMKMVVANTFVSAQPYDLASCLAMFTNISASVIFISRVEMNFRDKYKSYSEAVIGGRGIDIQNAQKRMFRQLAAELMNLARIQFIISIVLFLLCVVVLPQFGFSGLVMQIYPCLAAGYFAMFLMYSAIVFLYYYNDLTGAVLTALTFFFSTFFGSMFATTLTEKWYGIGLVIGALLGWTMAYFRLRWVERNMNIHVFCRGTLIEKRREEPESAKVYDIRDLTREKQKQEEMA